MKLNLSSCQKIVGAKEVKREILKGNALKVYVAKNADLKVTMPIINLCEEKEICLEYVENMKTLGKSFGIGINAACAAILI